MRFWHDRNKSFTYLLYLLTYSFTSWEKVLTIFFERRGYLTASIGLSGFEEWLKIWFEDSFFIQSVVLFD